MGGNWQGGIWIHLGPLSYSTLIPWPFLVPMDHSSEVLKILWAWPVGRQLWLPRLDPRGQWELLDLQVSVQNGNTSPYSEVIKHIKLRQRTVKAGIGPLSPGLCAGGRPMNGLPGQVTLLLGEAWAVGWPGAGGNQAVFQQACSPCSLVRRHGGQGS